MQAPMLPHRPGVLKCPKCEAVFFWWDSRLVRMRVGEPDIPEPAMPTEQDYYQLLALRRFTPEDELYARTLAWHLSNDQYRTGAPVSHEWTQAQRENLQRITELLSISDDSQRILKAEAFRELGDFKACLELLAGLEGSKDVGVPVRIIRNLATLRVSGVQRISPKEKPPASLAQLLGDLRSPNTNKRVDGVVGLRVLKLQQAPEELIKALIDDPSNEVRSWVALVLGEIGDKEAVPVLIRSAQDKTQNRSIRCNAIYSLGRMRAKPAEAAVCELIGDEDVKINAAIAWSQITGQRHRLVPDGYDLAP